MEQDEIIINLGKEEEIPFSDEATEEEIEEMTAIEVERLNAITNYYMENMFGDIEVEEEPIDFDDGGDITVG